MRMPACYLQEASWPVKAEHLDLALDEWRYAHFPIAPILPVKEGRGVVSTLFIFFNIRATASLPQIFFMPRCLR